MKSATDVMGTTDQRARLDREILGWMAEPVWKFEEARFDRLARALFAYQFAHCKAYGRFCAGRGITPDVIANWRDIPPVPTGAFKEIALRCFAEEHTCKTFRTSGTTGQTRGELHLDTLELYEASLLASLRTLLFPDRIERGGFAMRILAPSAEEAPDSSLSHMFSTLVPALGDANSGFDVRGRRTRRRGARRGTRERRETRRTGGALRHRVRVRPPARRTRCRWPTLPMCAGLADHGNRWIQGPHTRTDPARAARSARRSARAFQSAASSTSTG